LTQALTRACAVARFATSLPRYLSTRLDAEGARAHLRSALARRSERFLETMARGVFAVERSPYARLLRHAGIGERDVRGLVADQGVEGALPALYDAGVHVRLAEFKGRTPIRRGSLNLEVCAHDFDNPSAARSVEMSTGASRGGGTRLRLDIEHYRQDTLYDALFMEAFGLAGRPYAIWRPSPPWTAGLKGAMSHAAMGLGVERWFSQRETGLWPSHWPYGLLTGYAVAASHLAGNPIPFPEHVPLEDAVVVARWAAGHVAAGRRPLLNTNAASCVRICIAAGGAGLDISGMLFRVGSEPLTPGKAAAVARVGANVICH
jgi:hypothetical protein